MTKRALIETAFEWAAVNHLSADIYGKIQKLLEYNQVVDMPLADVKKLSEMSNMLMPYIFNHTASHLDIHLSTTTINE